MEVSASELDYALSALRRAANIMDNTNRFDFAREFRMAARDAQKELDRLNSALPELMSLKRSADRAYDIRVTTEREPECCSCHINAPCTYCTSHCAECEQHVDECECEEATS